MNPARFELATSRSGTERSIQLSQGFKNRLAATLLPAFGLLSTAHPDANQDVHSVIGKRKTLVLATIDVNEVVPAPDCFGEFPFDRFFHLFGQVERNSFVIFLSAGEAIDEMTSSRQRY